MRQFKDETGRPWTITVNLGTVKAVRGIAKVDLLDVAGGSLFQQLADDPIKLGDVLWVLCREQAEKAGVTEEEFAACLAGDSLNAATECLLEEICDFFPRPQRDLFRKALGRGRQVQERRTAEAMAMVDKALDEWEATTSSGSPTSAQES